MKEGYFAPRREWIGAETSCIHSPSFRFSPLEALCGQVKKRRGKYLMACFVFFDVYARGINGHRKCFIELKTLIVRILQITKINLPHRSSVRLRHCYLRQALPNKGSVCGRPGEALQGAWDTQTGRQAGLRGTHYEPGGKMNAGEREARRSVLFAMKAGEERESFSWWKNGGKEKKIMHVCQCRVSFQLLTIEG